VSGAGLPVSLGTVPTGFVPTGIALDPSSMRAYVTCRGVSTGTSQLAIFDVSTSIPTRLSTVPTGIPTTALALNPAGTRAYVLGLYSNVLQTYRLGANPQPLTVEAGGGLGSLASLPGAGRQPAAHGAVSSTGAVASSTGNFAVTHPALGSYRLSFTTNPLQAFDLNLAATVATLTGSAPGLLSYRTGLGYVDVLTYSPSGAAADRDFTFSVSLP
jgi:DNA-binding beta-propeller fold protein YncE